MIIPLRVKYQPISFHAPLLPPATRAAYVLLQSMCSNTEPQRGTYLHDSTIYIYTYCAQLTWGYLHVNVPDEVSPRFQSCCTIPGIRERPEKCTAVLQHKGSCNTAVEGGGKYIPGMTVCLGGYLFIFVFWEDKSYSILRSMYVCTCKRGGSFFSSKQQQNRKCPGRRERRTSSTSSPAGSTYRST